MPLPLASPPLPSPPSTSALDRYFALMQREHPHFRPGNLRYEMEKLFREVELVGRDVLDIGAGDGEVSLYAAAAGAHSVLALEPEAAGSFTGMRSDFERYAEELALGERIALEGVTFQEFQAGERRFDVVVLTASVNHLDEEACQRLHVDEDAQQSYREIFAKLASVCRPGADLIITDCSRRNLFADVGLRNPIVPMIEWRKHQAPRVWRELLESAGFERPRLDWGAPNTLRRPGRLLLGNALAAYLLTSSFRLAMRRASASAPSAP